MFGTLKPCGKDFPKKYREEYKKYYCGLCFAMHKNFGKFSRFLLNFDLTNDYLLSSSVRKEVSEENGICPWSITRREVPYIQCEELSDYFANLNYLLVYYKMLDDVRDDSSFIARCVSRQMEPSATAIIEKMPVEAALLEEYTQRLHYIEIENSFSPVFEPANLFACLLQQLVKPPFENDGDEDVFSAINYWMGLWIYTMDAILDCVSDHFRKNYNPILAGLTGDPIDILKSRSSELLKILCDCKTNILALLDMYPCFRHGDLLRKLFMSELPKFVSRYLEVHKNEQ